MNKNLLSQCFIREEKFKPNILDGKIEITLRELKISENQKFREILLDETKTQDDAVFYAVSCSMVEPKFFTEKELEELNTTGFNLIKEIFEEIPLIGKTTKERDEYKETIKRIIEQSQKNKEEVLEDTLEKK